MTRTHQLTCAYRHGPRGTDAFNSVGRVGPRGDRVNKAYCVAFGVLAVVLSGCTATTTMSGAQDATTVAVKKTESTVVPRTETLTTTSFGNYEFRAETPGLEPFTGILPLKFNGGYLALDILFFAPAMFFNLREPFRFYEFDLEQRVVRYRSKESQDWTVYVPSDAEAARGKAFFETRNGK